MVGCLIIMDCETAIWSMPVRMKVEYYEQSLVLTAVSNWWWKENPRAD